MPRMCLWMIHGETAWQASLSKPRLSASLLEDGVGKAEGGSWASPEVHANGERGQLDVGVSGSEKGHLSTELSFRGLSFVKRKLPYL